VDDILDRPFAALAAARCPAYDEMLVAVEREFRAVHRDPVADALDEAARSLFPLADAPIEERVVALARAAWALLPDEAFDAPDWLLACALREIDASAALVTSILAGSRPQLPRCVLDALAQLDEARGAPREPALARTLSPTS
jgi:hypothetical protein